MPSINEETRLHKHVHTLMQSNADPHTHTEKAKFKYPNDFSSMWPTHMHNLSIFSLTLICLCINIRGCWGMWGGVCLLISPTIPLRSGLRQNVCCVDSELTHMPQRCHPPAQTVCVALHRPLQIFSEMMEDSGTNAVPAGKKTVPSEVKKHTVSLSYSVVKLVYSSSLANIPKKGTATVDPLRVDEDRITWTTERTRKKLHSPLWRWAV